MPNEMKAEQIGAAAALVGLLMVVAAVIWPSVDDSRSAWSDEDAKAYQETIARVHVGAHMEARAQEPPRMHGGEPADPNRIAEHREDVKSLDKLKQKLDSAKARPHRIAGILQWSGAGLVTAGIAVLLVGRNRNY